MSFRDLFSDRSDLYSKYRPTYPDELFDFISAAAPDHRLAWDCATGSGQAATALTGRFDNVIATDASENQIAQARAHPGIEYRVATAYESGIASGSADAVTVAQAMHWLDAHRFYQEAKRVLADGGVLVIWGYGDPVVEPEPVNRILHEYNRGTIERFWQPERDILLDGYRRIPFPFQELEVPEFTLEARWNLDELSGLLRSW